MRQRIPRQDQRDPEEQFLEQLAWLLDRSIKIGPFSFGLDALLGLIPGFGDMAGGALSALIIVKGFKAGLPRVVILRMVANVGIDSLLGAIPFIGDIFDFAYKANVKNLKLFQEAATGRRQPIRDWAFIGLIVLLMALFIAIPIISLLYLARLLGPYMPAF